MLFSQQQQQQLTNLIASNSNTSNSASNNNLSQMNGLNNMVMANDGIIDKQVIHDLKTKVKKFIQ